MDENTRLRMANQMRRGDLILFTGAGFSLGAKGRSGDNLPTAKSLRDRLWPLAFPGSNPDSESKLGDVYHAAFKQAGNAVRDMCNSLLTVDPASIPSEYETWFSCPWFRMYTVNVDDLEEAASHAFVLPRKILSISALTELSIPSVTNELLCVHLNGRVGDFPDMTFSDRQYAERTSQPDPWYHHLVADLSNKPIVFVGTTLDEPPLWQHLEMRGSRNRGSRELRPGSYLVTPNLSLGRQAFLSDLNIEWVQMDEQEFAESILVPLNTERIEGLKALEAKTAQSAVSPFISLDSLDLTHRDDLPEYLMGREPVWQDVSDGYAVAREFEQELFPRVQDPNENICVVTGTAGSGKTTSLMRLGFFFRAEGKNVVWVNQRYEGPISRIRREIRQANPDVIIIDDVDLFGRAAGPFLSDLLTDMPSSLVVAATRSTRYEGLELRRHLQDGSFFQFTVPHLEDSDISLLLQALEDAKRLGALKGKSRADQERAFRESAGRQLLVALVETTSGQRFEEKIDRECSELGPDLGLIYAIICLATSLRHHLLIDEVLTATGDSSNETLNKIKALEDQKLIIPGESAGLRIRHRYVADRSLEYFKSNRQLGEPMRGLLFSMATRVQPTDSRRTREWSLLVLLLNHEFILRLVMDVPNVRQCYEEVETVLSWDYHYWLQRGCFEVKTGNLRLAQNFLEQAKSIQPGDVLVQTEWSYMMIKRALEDPTNMASPVWVAQAFGELEDAISQRGSVDSYPYHVYGSQGLAWARRAPMSDQARTAFLEKLRSVMREATSRHASERDITNLSRDVETDYLQMSLPRGERRFQGPLPAEEEIASSEE